MNPRLFLGWAIALAVLLALGVSKAPAADAGGKPNVIFFLADDLGLDGLSCYGGQKIKTPNIDALASTGLRFTTCYAMPLCGPTRTTFNTGRYTFRTGAWTNQSTKNTSYQKEVGIAKVMKQAGYATAQVGKWRQMGATPADWGYEQYITDPTAGGWYWKDSYTKNGQAVKLNKEVYYEDVIYDFAVDFIKQNQEKPFFLYYATHLVHGPILRTPDSKPGGNLYNDNLAYMDKQLGKLLAELDRLKLREKTLVIFAGDNGTAGGSGKINGRQIHGAKGSMLEGGARVPLIANWTGTVPAGKVNNDLIDFTDMFPTIAELGGASLPQGVKIDGRSFAPQLKGQAGNPRQWAFVQLGQRWYVRDARYKLTQAGELFDLQEAPFQEIPVAPGADAPAAAARKTLQAVLDELNPSGEAAPPKAKKGNKKPNGGGKKNAR